MYTNHLAPNLDGEYRMLLVGIARKLYLQADNFFKKSLSNTIMAKSQM